MSRIKKCCNMCSCYSFWICFFWSHQPVNRESLEERIYHHVKYDNYYSKIIVAFQWNSFCRFSTLHCVHSEQKWVKSKNDILLFLAQNYFCMNFRHTCGGSIIGNSTFITAAHCFFDHYKRQIPSNKFLIVSGKYKQVFFNE